MKDLKEFRTKLLIGQIKKKFVGQKATATIRKIAFETMENVLIVVPHADDEVIGCGGLIQELVSRNINVYVLCITVEDDRSVANPVYVNGKNLRVLESQQVQRFLGYKQIKHLGIPERSFEQNISLRKKISESIKQWMTFIRVYTIFIPNHFDMNPDHRTVYDICLETVNQMNNLKEIYLYEVWGPTHATHYYPLSYEQYRYKLHAMQLYKTQMGTVDYCKIIDEINSARDTSFPNLLNQEENKLVVNKEFFERIEVRKDFNYLTFRQKEHAY